MEPLNQKLGGPGVECGSGPTRQGLVPLESFNLSLACRIQEGCEQLCLGLSVLTCANCLFPRWASVLCSSVPSASSRLLSLLYPEHSLILPHNPVCDRSSKSWVLDPLPLSPANLSEQGTILD